MIDYVTCHLPLLVRCLAVCTHCGPINHARLSSYRHGAMTVDFLEGFYRPYDAR